MENKIFETVSFHIVKPCDKKCKFCYATFDDMVVKQMSLIEAMKIIDKLAETGVQKVTFAGGEPLLYKYIKEIIMYTKAKGITTSIITNGGRLTTSWLETMKPYLDWIGLSIDSFDDNINIKSGRFISKNDTIPYRDLVASIIREGYKLKINTVVHAFNKYDVEFLDFINHFKDNILRWKIFETLRVEGQNDLQFTNIKVTNKEYNNYVATAFRYFREQGINDKIIVPENNEAMTGSYLLIDPQGRFFENSKGYHNYSRPIVNNSIDDCLSDINLNREMFIKRGGIYDWK